MSFDDLKLFENSISLRLYFESQILSYGGISRMEKKKERKDGKKI